MNRGDPTRPSDPLISSIPADRPPCNGAFAVDSERTLRVAIIFTVIGILVLAHRCLANNHRLPVGVELMIGVVLVLLGVPQLVVAVRRYSHEGDQR